MAQEYWGDDELEWSVRDLTAKQNVDVNSFQLSAQCHSNGCGQNVSSIIKNGIGQALGGSVITITVLKHLFFAFVACKKKEQKPAKP